MIDAPGNPPRRRWFRFGLRTLFVVVTVCSLWLGWQAKIVRDRREALRSFGASITVYWGDASECPTAARPPIPLWRRCCGDHPVYAIEVTRSHRGRSRLERLFPEAIVTSPILDGTPWDMPPGCSLAPQTRWFLTKQ